MTSVSLGDSVSVSLVEIGAGALFGGNCRRCLEHGLSDALHGDSERDTNRFNGIADGVGPKQDR
jgi:hypothetical protein